MIDPPKYSVGTLLLSNVPYYHGEHRDRELGWIIYIYQKSIPFTKVTIYMYVVEWNGPNRNTPSSYTVEDIDCFVFNLKNFLKK